MTAQIEPEQTFCEQNPTLANWLFAAKDQQRATNFPPTPGRKVVAELAAGLRPFAAFSLVATDLGQQKLLGFVDYYPIAIGGEYHCLLLSPLSVHPDHKGNGIGGQLVEQSLAIAAGLGHQRVLLKVKATEADRLVPFYQRLGFAQNPAAVWPVPDEQPLVFTKALQPSAWAGVGGKVTHSGRLHKDLKLIAG